MRKKEDKLSSSGSITKILGRKAKNIIAVSVKHRKKITQKVNRKPQIIIP